MKSVTVTMSPERVESKPTTKKEKEKWAKEVGISPAIDLTIEELAHTICVEKFSFCHVTCHNRWIAIENFKQSQLIVVDVDGNLSPQEALDRLQRLDLPNPNIIYRTLSDPTSSELCISEKLNQTKKFRMIFVLDKPVRDYRTYEMFVKQGMYIIFPESDHVGVTQKWLPGKETIFMDTESYLSPLNLMCIADSLNTEKLGERQRKNRYQKKYQNVPPDIFHDANLVDVDVESIPKTANSLSIIKQIGKTGNIRNFDWEGAAEIFELFGAFYRKERKITNPELMGLYSGMRRIEGGSLLWKRLVKDNDLINKRHLAIADWFNVVIAKGGNPWEQRIVDYAPAASTANPDVRLTDIHFKRGGCAIELNKIKEIPLKEAEQKLDNFMIEALDPITSGTFICKGATALGKTEYYVRHITDGCIVLVPNHHLKDEIVRRMDEAEKKHLFLPDCPELPEPIKNEYDKFHKIGDHQGAARFLHRMSRDLNAAQYGLTVREAFPVQQQLTKFFDLIKDCRQTTLPIITTHKQILFTEFPNHHTIIVDEDITPTLFEMGSFSTKDLRILKEAFQRNDGNMKDLAVLEGLLNDLSSNSQLYRHVQSTSEGRFEIFENYEDLSRLIYRIADKIEGQILPFFWCNHYIIDIEDRNDPNGEKVVHYVIDYRGKFPASKKVLMLSATANEHLCRKVFGNIHWTDISHVEHNGKRIQYSDKSWSRSSLVSKHYKPFIKLINDRFPNEPKITYKRYRNLFTNPAFDSQKAKDISLENCAGTDALNGKHIVVVGNGHVPTYVYRLMAVALGIEFTAEDFDLSEQQIEYNRYNFWFMTFKHEGLRAIQFYFVESILTQAVGRNRGLRENAACHLFSNFPLVGFEQKSMEELISAPTSSSFQTAASVPLYATSGSVAC